MKVLSRCARAALIAAAIPGMCAWGSAAPKAAHEAAQPPEEEEIEPRPEDVIWKQVEKFPYWTALSATLSVNKAGVDPFPVKVEAELTGDMKRFRTFRISSRSFSHSYDLDECVKAGKPHLGSLYIEYYVAEREEDFEFIVDFYTLEPKAGKSGITGYDRYVLLLGNGLVKECEFTPYE